MTTETKLSLTANLLGLVAPFIGRGDIRYYLDGISVRPAKGGGAIIAATNGHAMAMALDRNAVCEEEVILRVNGHLLQACAALPQRESRRLELRNGRLMVTRGEGPDSDVYIQAGNPFVEGKFPDIFLVVPSPESLKPGMIGGYNPRVLDLVNQASRHVGHICGVGKHGLYALQFWTQNGERCEQSVARVEGFNDWFAVLMPAKCDEPKQVTPQFLLDEMEARK